MHTTVRGSHDHEGAGVTDAENARTRDDASTVDDDPTTVPADRWAQDAADAVTGRSDDPTDQRVERLVQVLGRVVDGLDTVDIVTIDRSTLPAGSATLSSSDAR